MLSVNWGREWRGARAALDDGAVVGASEQDAFGWRELREDLFICGS